MKWFGFVERILVPTLVIALLAGGIAGILLGCGLIFRSAATLNFIARMNRWISTGQALKPLDEPRDIEPGPRLRRPWVGGFLALGSAFVLYFLLVRLPLPRGVTALAIGLLALKWFFVAGALLALAVGVMML